MAQGLLILRWYLALQVLGLVCLPLTLVVFRGLPDRGYPLSKILSVLLITYFNWIAVSTGIFSYSTFTLAASALLLLVVSLALLFRFREEIIDALRTNLKLVVLYEVFFLVVFLVFLVIRGHDPDIFGTEKFMDFSFITGLSRNTGFPPQDQWLSGEPVNYYYFGYLIISNLIRMSGVPPEYGYNLVVASLAGLTFVSVSSIAYNLSRRVTVAVAAGIFMIFLGNLDGFREFLSAESLAAYNWWDPSRVIGRGDTINEFPFFTLLHADLHPHVNALPFFMLMIASVMNIMFFRRRVPWLYFGYLAVLIGGLWIMNPWDLPLSILLLWLVLMLRIMMEKPGFQRAVIYILAPAIIVACDRFILYAPFHGSFKSFSQGFGAKLAHTSLPQMLLIWGFFFFVLFTFLLANLVRSGVLKAVDDKRATLPEISSAAPPGAFRSAEKLWATGLGAVLLIVLGLYFSSMVLAVTGAGILTALLAVTIMRAPRPGVFLRYKKLWAPAVAAALLIVIGVFCLSNMVIVVTAFGLALSIANLFLLRKERERAFILILVLVAFAIFLGCEFFYVKDTYGDRLYRMNTIFKFYFQAWTLVAIAAACSLPAISAALGKRGGRWAWNSAFVLLLFASLTYTFCGTWVRSGRFRRGFDLNGMAYMKRDHPGDYEAVAWLNGNVRGAPVILEATKDPYTYFSRISSNTGLPTVLGWGNHEGLWRSSWELPQKRKRDVDEMYNTADNARALELLGRYGVRLVYVGELERRIYKPSGLRKFSSFMRPVWRGRESVIYEFLAPLGSSITKGYPQLRSVTAD